ncbi:hypothetical protein HK101_008809 [Irineochytrium annulatum]|nr:hypothetical protein HK101_008809 [Irineochytrium annulatum]
MAFEHVCVITGGTSGIGAAVACEIASCCPKTAIALISSPEHGKCDRAVECSKNKGDHVIECAKNEGDHVVQCVKNKGAAACQAYFADLSKPHAVKQVVDKVVQDFGGKINCLINCAGVYQSCGIDQVSEEHFCEMFDNNVKTAVFMCSMCVPHMSEGGAIVNVSSATTHCPLPRESVYIASKGAVEALTRALAVELAPKGIRVNTISPGFTETKLLPESQRQMAEKKCPFKRAGKPEEVASVIAFMASPKARWVTGQNINADGGVACTL